MQMLEDVGTPERTELWIREAFAAKRKIMGFGHAVYRTARTAVEPPGKGAPLVQRVE